MPAGVGESLNVTDDRRNLVHALLSVVCVAVHVFGAKVPPVEAVYSSSSLSWNRIVLLGVFVPDIHSAVDEFLIVR